MERVTENFYMHISYQSRSSAMGFKACHFKSARVPQAMLTTFYSEENVQKQIFIEKPSDFHVFHLYICFWLRIEVSPHCL